MPRMNTAVKQQSRKRRQYEGKRQPQPYFPPNLELSEGPLTFAYSTKSEQEQRQNLFMPPAYDPNELVELPTSYKPDTELDPIPVSDEYAEGLKIRPWAHIRVPTYLAIAQIENVDNSDFENGWYQGKAQFDQLVSQYVGQQHPIDVTPLIPEAEYTTYGALNQLEPGQIAEFPSQDGYLFD